MLMPRRCLEVSDTSQLSCALGTVALRIGANPCNPPRTVERIQIIRGVARDLVKYVEIAGQYRNAQRKRLDKRHAVTLDERREEQRTRVLQPGAQTCVAAARFFDDDTFDRIAALEHVYDVLAFPATAPDDDELGCTFPERFDEPAPGAITQRCAAFQLAARVLTGYTFTRYFENYDVAGNFAQ